MMMMTVESFGPKAQNIRAGIIFFQPKLTFAETSKFNISPIQDYRVVHLVENNLFFDISIRLAGQYKKLILLQNF